MSFVGQYFTQSIFLDKKYYISDILTVSKNTLITIISKIIFYTASSIVIFIAYSICILIVNHENTFTIINVLYFLLFTLDICSFCLIVSILSNEETLSYYIVFFLGIVRSFGVFYILKELNIELNAKVIIICTLTSILLLVLSIYLFSNPSKKTNKGI